MSMIAAMRWGMSLISFLLLVLLVLSIVASLDIFLQIMGAQHETKAEPPRSIQANR